MTRTHTILLCALTATLGCGSSASSSGDPPLDAAPPPDTDQPPTDAPPFTLGVSTLAGAADPGLVDGDRNVARFSNPVNVARAADGTIYVADFDNNRLRAVDRAGTVTTVIVQAGFQRPFGMAIAGDGTLFVSTDNDPKGGHSAMSGSVWRIDVAGRVATSIVAGIGRPRGLAALPDGRLAIADNFHHVVRVLNPATGALTTIAGTWDAPGFADATGAAARFSRPYGLAVRPDGNLVVADTDNHRLRLVIVATGAVSTLAGTGVAGFRDDALGSAKFAHPQAVAIDTAGDVYVTDLDNFRIRRVRGTLVDTVAGCGNPGYLDSDDRLAAKMFGLEGLAVAPDGAGIYIADGSRGEQVLSNRIRVVDMSH